jgi:hypothetical protein
VEHQELTKRRSRAARMVEQGDQQNQIKQNRAATRSRSRRRRRALDYISNTNFTSPTISATR